MQGYLKLTNKVQSDEYEKTLIIQDGKHLNTFLIANYNLNFFNYELLRYFCLTKIILNNNPNLLTHKKAIITNKFIHLIKKHQLNYYLLILVFYTNK